MRAKLATITLLASLALGCNRIVISNDELSKRDCNDRNFCSSITQKTAPYGSNSVVYRTRDERQWQSDGDGGQIFFRHCYDTTVLGYLIRNSGEETVVREIPAEERYAIANHLQSRGVLGIKESYCTQWDVKPKHVEP
jgi:hypothetical protein